MVKFLQGSLKAPYRKHIIKKGGTNVDGWLGIYQRGSRRELLFFLLNIERRDLNRKTACRAGYLPAGTEISDHHPPRLIPSDQPSDEDYWRWAQEQAKPYGLPLCFLTFSSGGGVTFWYPDVVPANWMYVRLKGYLMKG